jgi:hypothetical protein
MFLITPAAQAKLAGLRHLDMIAFVLLDPVLQVILEHLPALTHVELGHMHLEDNHAAAQMASSWEELRLSGEADIASLARLPLRCIKRVLVSSLKCYVEPLGVHNTAAPRNTSAPAQLAAALAAAPHCSFSCLIDDEIHLQCAAKQMPALLPLLTRWEGVKTLCLNNYCRDSQQLTPAVVGALGSLLESMPSCTVLSMHGFTPSPCAMLLPALARTSVADLHLYVESQSEAQLMVWLAGGQPGNRPLTVNLWPKPEEQISESFTDDVATVRAALAEAGSAVEVLLPDDKLC